MKPGSLIDKSAEFQTNRLMDVQSAQLLVGLVPGGRGIYCRFIKVILQRNGCYVLSCNCEFMTSIHPRFELTLSDL